MKREGRQHGMVKSYMILPSPWDPKPKSKIVNKLDSMLTARTYVKVSSKPNNHSKFTGKCGKAGCKECHVHPASKSKDKAKGTQKLKSSNVTMDHKSLAWRVVGHKGHGPNYRGMSAAGILCHMSSDDSYNNEIEEEEEAEIAMKAIEIEDEVDDMNFYDVRFGYNGQIHGDEGWCVVREV